MRRRCEGVALATHLFATSQTSLLFANYYFGTPSVAMVRNRGRLSACHHSALGVRRHDKGIKF
jgi:hypothetical protein